MSTLCSQNTQALGVGLPTGIRGSFLEEWCQVQAGTGLGGSNEKVLAVVAILVQGKFIKQKRKSVAIQ